MEIWLIRHTTPAVDKGVCYGQLDLDVSDSFIDEAKAIKDCINEITFDQVYTSPLIRCQRLAHKLFSENTIHEDDRLMELNFGDWENKKWMDIDKATMESWANNFMDQSPPNGETFRQLVNRVNDFIDHLPSKVDKVALVTHSGVIRALLMKYLQIPSERIFNLQLQYGAVAKINIISDQYQQVEFIK